MESLHVLLSQREFYREKLEKTKMRTKISKRNTIHHSIKITTPTFNYLTPSCLFILALTFHLAPTRTLSAPNQPRTLQGSQQQQQQQQQQTNQPTNLSQFSHSGLCASRASCKLKGRRRDLDVGPELSKRLCYCDQSCLRYDDCCADSPFAQTLDDRLKLGRERLEQIRQQWFCHKLNPIFGDVLLKASCAPQWRNNQPDSQLAELVERRCEYLKSGRASSADLGQLDPLGLIMPITDLSNGVTYANSYCLRCNKLASTEREMEKERESKPITPAKLIYWSPLLDCSYNIENDDKNTLIDLISSSKGQVLEYSSKKNKWLLVANKKTSLNSTLANSTVDSERVCSVTPTVPDSVEHMIRYCKSGLVRQCPGWSRHQLALSTSGGRNSSLERAKLECQFGHQSLAYGHTSSSVYFNPACASCNQEKQVFCEPKLGKNLLPELANRVVVSQSGRNNTDRHFFPPGSEGNEGEPEEEQNGRGVSSRGGSPGSASFSVLIDLYGAAGDEQVGAIHQCPDQQNQVYDPFYLACRDLVCGLNQRFVDGKCVSLDSSSSALKDNLVDKFKPAMAYLTIVCLVISIAALAVYLLLYCLSMFDLRHLLIDQKNQESSKKLKRASRGSNISSNSTNSSNKSQSLSSRGVACLASSLLAAYLLFILGHHQTSDSSSSSPWPTSSLNSTQDKNSATVGCVVVAVATYYCFLVAFSWMFLLSYDIWRTLRLATCQLRGPALHSQSKRFITYTLFALLGSAIFVGFAILLDLVPLTCELSHSAAITTNQSRPVCPEMELSELGHFVQSYRPRFGQQSGSCWFSNRRALALFFGLPVTFIMLVNLLFFLHSSFMVIKTSSRSSRHLQNQRIGNSQKTPSSPKLISVVSRVDSSTSSNCSSESSSQDFANQNSMTTNSMISVQTIQSHLSGSDEPSGDEESPDGARGAATNPLTGLGEPQQKRKLESSHSSSSLTNQSVGGNSLTASLASKCDSHLQSLSSAMGSVVKDYRLYCRLSTIMGLTWLTGIMASLVDQSQLLWYLFVVLNTLQGLFIFIAFGCKRSKLANLEILLNYARFKFKEAREGCRKRKDQKGAT